jgi:hypothetical protein
VTKASTVTMTVKKGVTVVRDGQRIRPEIGKTFDFTAEERDAIMETNPSVLAKPEGEAEGEAVPASTSAKTTTTTTSSAESSQAKARGGKKAATANKSDAEAAAGKTDAEASTDDDL